MVKRLPAMQETRAPSLGREDPLEKEMATHSSTLARKIPRTEEPCRLQSMVSQQLSSFTHSLQVKGWSDIKLCSKERLIGSPFLPKHSHWFLNPASWCFPQQEQNVLKLNSVVIVMITDVSLLSLQTKWDKERAWGIFQMRSKEQTKGLQISNTPIISYRRQIFDSWLLDRKYIYTHSPHINP